MSLSRVRKIFRRKKEIQGAPETDNIDGPCLLLTRLPIDIRICIYKYVLDQGTIHFLSEKGYAFYVPCRECNSPSPQRCNARMEAAIELRYWGMALDNISEFGWGNPYISPGVVSRGQVGLIRACRQIYREALPVLYSSVSFQVDEPETWIRFSRYMGEGNLALVRSLGVTLRHVPATLSNSGVYANFWKILATQMAGLRELGINIQNSTLRVERDITAEWHAPLRQVRGLKHFHMEIGDGTQDSQTAEGTAQLVQYLSKIMCSTQERKPEHEFDVLSIELPAWSPGWSSGYVSTEPD